MNTQKVQMLSTDFCPKNEFILVKPAEFERETETPAGIIVPLNQTSTDRPTSGVVVSVGSDIKDIKEGIFVLWPNTDGLDIEMLDGIFILLQYKSIIGSRKVDLKETKRKIVSEKCEEYENTYIWYNWTNRKS